MPPRCSSAGSPGTPPRRASSRPPPASPPRPSPRGCAARAPPSPATNPPRWLPLRRRVGPLASAPPTTPADLLVMTGAVYLTGGPHSPLLPIYFIEVAVMALLTNLGLTIVTL